MDPLALTRHTAGVNGLKRHFIEAGAGPPVLLLHGFPETWFCWRHRIPAHSSPQHARPCPHGLAQDLHAPRGSARVWATDPLGTPCYT